MSSWPSPVDVGDDSFVNVSLDDASDAVHAASSRAMPVGRSSLGWKSQFSLHNANAPSPQDSLHKIRNRSLASSSTPNLLRQSSPGDDVSLNPGSEPQPAAESSYLHTTPKRVVEGRYRSRLEKSGSSRLRPLLLAEKDPKPPRGVVYDSNMVPGVSITVQDSNGELLAVRSPSKAGCSGMRINQDQKKSPDLSVQKQVSNKNSPKDGLSSNDTSLNDGSLSSAPCYSEDQNETILSSKLTDAPAAIMEHGVGKETRLDSTVRSESESSRGPSFTKASNLTRMPHLPPKPKEEEAKHLADFFKMMRESKLAEKKRVVSRRSELLKRQEEEERAQVVWEHEILPCWTRAKEEKIYRDLWWDGIPQVLRARLWPRACGNDLMLSHNLFDRASKAVQQCLAANVFPSALIKIIKRDIACTLPSLRLFDEKSGPLWQDLFDVLLAFVFVRADEAAQREKMELINIEQLQNTYSLYVPGLANLAALLIMNLPTHQTLIVLLNLIAKKSWLRAIYGLQCRVDSDDHNCNTFAIQLQGYERVFNALLAERMPHIYANLHKASVRPDEYVREWIRTLFVPWVEIDTAAHLWDIMYVSN